MRCACAWCDSGCEMNGLACLALVLLPLLAAAPAPHDNASSDTADTSTSHTHASGDADTDTFLLQPEPVPDGKPHHLEVGACNATDALLHAETLIVNNDGTSRVTGDIRVNVEAPVNITCFKVLDQSGETSGAFPSFKQGGLGHNYVVLGFDTAYGFGFNFLVELYGHDINNTIAKE